MNLESSWAALADAVASAKETDPLHPVTVVTSGHSLSRDIVSWLARHPAFSAGLVHVRVTPVMELVRLVAQTDARLGDRGEVQPIQREAAVRRVLTRDPGVFGELASSRHTIRALARSCASLDGVDVPAEALGVSALTDEVLRVHHEVRQVLSAECVTPDELVDIAQERILGDPQTVALLGKVVVFLPVVSERAVEARFLRWLMSYDGVAVIDWPGVDGADGGAGPLEGAEVVTASNPDDEARGIVRMVADEIASGTPGHKIGVFFGPEDPYRVLLHRYLREAGISVSGKLPRQLADQSAPRFLLRLLGTGPDSPIDPVLVLDAIAAHGLVDHQRLLPKSSDLERVYRKVRFSAEGGESEQRGDADALAREAEDLAVRDLFVSYLQMLREEMTHVHASTSWETVASRLRDFSHRHIRPDSARGKLPDAHGISLQSWWEALHTVIESLASLDRIGVGPTPASIVEELEQAIALSSGESTAVGRGVLLADLRDGVGRDLDVVIVCGLVEGVLPSRFSPDPLLPDEFVDRVGGGLMSALDRVSAQRERFFRVLLSARRRLVVTVPRGDLRGSGNRVASRWLASLMDQRGAIVGARDIVSLQAGILQGQPAPSDHPAFVRELRIRQAASTTEAIPPGLSASDTGQFQATRQMIHDRFRGVFSRFNGNLTGSEASDVLPEEKKVSPSSLERYASNPLSFFLEDVLFARPLEELSLEADMDSLQRGVLVHEVLDTWVRAHPEPARSDFSSLEALLRERAEIQRHNYGSFWIDVFHQKTVEGLVEELSDWLDEHLRRLRAGTRVLGTERPFGYLPTDHHRAVADEVAVTLDDGETVRFRGQVDRIDLRSDGVFHVIDYKTGSKTALASIANDPPTKSRTRFQLAVYGLLARHLASAHPDVTSLESSYWFIRESAKRDRSGQPDSDVTISLDEDTFEAIEEDLRLVLGLIRGGYFPPRPGNPRVDSYTRLLGEDALEDAWEKLRSDPTLRAFRDVFSLDEGEGEQ